MCKIGTKISDGPCDHLASWKMGIQVQENKKIENFFHSVLEKTIKMLHNIFLVIKAKTRAILGIAVTGGIHVKLNPCSAVKFLLSDTDRNLHLWLPVPVQHSLGDLLLLFSLICIRNLILNPRENVEMKAFGFDELCTAGWKKLQWNEKVEIFVDIVCADKLAESLLSTQFISKKKLTLKLIVKLRNKLKILC